MLDWKLCIYKCCRSWFENLCHYWIVVSRETRSSEWLREWIVKLLLADVPVQPAFAKLTRTSTVSTNMFKMRGLRNFVHGDVWEITTPLLMFQIVFAMRPRTKMFNSFSCTHQSESLFLSPQLRLTPSHDSVEKNYRGFSLPLLRCLPFILELPYLWAANPIAKRLRHGLDNCFTSSSQGQF